jgi:hypothetical protein
MFYILLHDDTIELHGKAKSMKDLDLIDTVILSSERTEYNLDDRKYDGSFMDDYIDILMGSTELI